MTLHTVGHRTSVGCEVICESGAYAGRQCPKSSRFTVAGKRACGRHVGLAIEQASKPGKRSVAVVPDYYVEL